MTGGEAGGEARPRPRPLLRFAVPWRSDGGHREGLWRVVRSRLEEYGWPIVEGRSPDGPFNRSAAINDAARGDWDVIIVHDADVLIDPAQVRAAVEIAERTGRVVLPFERFVGLTPHMSQRAMRGEQVDWNRGARFRSDEHESSCVVVPRAAFERVGGFDERFIGWGQEDVSFVQSARVLVGEIERVPGIVWHLWHPRSRDRRPDGNANRPNRALGQRYRDARDAAAVEALIAERGDEVGERAARFARIYDVNEWRGRDGTRAGPGSSLEATAALVAALPDILADLGATSVLDAGCGDSLWMPELLGYVGVDIVPRAIRAARQRHPDRTYEVRDVCVDELPRCDAVICRDALQHLSFADGLAAVSNFRRSGAKWLLANTHRGGVNVDVPSGEWYEVDLEAAPFWLGRPVREMPDGMWAGNNNRYPNKFFCVWELQ